MTRALAAMCPTARCPATQCPATQYPATQSRTMCGPMMRRRTTRYQPTSWPARPQPGARQLTGAQAVPRPASTRYRPTGRSRLSPTQRETAVQLPRAELARSQRPQWHPASRCRSMARRGPAAEKARWPSARCRKTVSLSGKTRAPARLLLRHTRRRPGGSRLRRYCRFRCDRAPRLVGAARGGTRRTRATRTRAPPATVTRGSSMSLARRRSSQ